MRRIFPQLFDFVRHNGKAGEHYMTDQMTMKRSDGSDVKVMHRIFYFNDGEPYVSPYASIRHLMTKSVPQ